MTNEELLEQIANGDEAALTKLCLVNTGLVKERARSIARQYHCLRQTKYGGLSDYAKETLSDLESVGKLALVECVRAGNYDAEKGRFTTYITPFLDGAMRRYLECSLGTLSLDRDSMGLVRKAQRLYHQEGKEPREICASLGISLRAVLRAIAYPTHFLSVYDLQGPNDEGNIYERLASTRLSISTEDAVIRTVTMECLREEFLRLSKKEQDTLRDMRIVQEMYARGFEFMPIDIYRAKARNFQIIDGKLMPSLSSIDGLGEKAANAIVFAAEDGKFLSKEDFINRTKVTKTVCDLMAELGILTGLPESNQLSLFDMVM